LGEVPPDAFDLKLCGVRIVSHAKIIREGVAGVKKGNQFWIRIFYMFAESIVQTCRQRKLISNGKAPLPHYSRGFGVRFQ
ncbi:MAG: hypothetical protein IJ787_06805, partial [Bacilli bacterium]|nr:hypothetical protein [Bacilli bacterium]